MPPGGPPETKYAKSGDVHIAYQVVGSGPVDLVCVPGWVSHVEYQWEDPATAAALRRLASFARLILFDKRGTGLSDRVPEAGPPTLEQRIDDVRAVMDAAGSARAALFGVSEGGPMALLFAATYPARTAALVLYGSFPVRRWAPDAPWALTPEQYEVFCEAVERDWGTGGDLNLRSPGLARDERRLRWYAAFCRVAASPGAALALLRMNYAIDVRPVLPAIRVPTLLLHRAGDQRVDAGASRYMAGRIPGARYVELPGADHAPWVGDADAIVDEIEAFLTGARPPAAPDRVLATVLVTDIVGSTGRAAQLGDRRWREALTAHHALVRRELERFRGREVDTAGDGFLATFDGPARAIRCAGAVVEAVRPLGLEVRAGLHTGEVELMGDRIAGIAVHLAARVAALAGPGEVLVSRTVKDLVAGSGLDLIDRGTHRLRGMPERWPVFAVRAAAPPPGPAQAGGSP
jgi:pimeloyl-ACP methyl ester carboxylesterase